MEVHWLLAIPDYSRTVILSSLGELPRLVSTDEFEIAAKLVEIGRAIITELPRDATAVLSLRDLRST